MQAFPAHFSRDEIEIINAESSESADTADKDWVQMVFWMKFERFSYIRLKSRCETGLMTS